MAKILNCSKPWPKIPRFQKSYHSGTRGGKEIREEGNEGTPLSNYPATCKCTSSRSEKEVADSGELSVTADPLAGDDDDKFELATFPNQSVRRLVHLSQIFSKQSSSYFQQLVLAL